MLAHHLKFLNEEAILLLDGDSLEQDLSVILFI
jgi:hypothetical protein